MPELPEVETVRRMLAETLPGRRVKRVRLSGKPLRTRVPRPLVRGLADRTFVRARRHGKFLMLDLDGDMTLISHLGMSGRWLFHERPPGRRPTHVHIDLEFRDGSRLWFEDPRRFGIARLVRTDRVSTDPSIALLGPDPIATPPTGELLHAMARGTRLAVKNFLLDQRRIAGVGNIYASEILHRSKLDPRRRAGSLSRAEWERVARDTVRVLREAIRRMGTTFSMYRTVSGEPGGYSERLRVYERTGQPCLTCGSPILRVVQGQRSTFYCRFCQPRRPAGIARRTVGSH